MLWEKIHELSEDEKYPTCCGGSHGLIEGICKKSTILT